MSVKKIFMTLITVVVCVVLGALVLNVLLPNVTTSLITAVEDMVFNATGMAFDFNGDGNAGSANATGSYANIDGNVTDGGNAESLTVGVEGFGTGE